MASTTMQEMNFRTKFLDWLSKAGVSTSIIATAFAVAMKMDENPLFWLLWKLSFEPCSEKALNELGFTADESSTGEDLKFIPNELVMPLRNELRYQYQKLHEDFLWEYDSKNEELYNAFGKDIILTAGICRRLYKYIKNHRNVDERNKVIFLLQSDKENFVFGGLKELGFTNAEAEVIWKKADVIVSVFKQMVDKDSAYETYLDSIGKPMTYKPFEALEDYEVVPVLPDEPDEPAESQEEEEFTNQLNAKAVLENIELLKQFLGVVDKLDVASIDPFDVLDREKEIRALLSSLEALS